MGKSKKSVAKTKSQKSREAVSNNEGVVEARPQHEGKDPLAEGNTLENPTNTEAETHYNVKERSVDVQKAEENASTIDGQNANERAEVHNAQASVPHSVPNSDAEEQEEVAAGRVEEDVNPPVDDTPEDVEVPERTEEQEEEDSEDRQEAMGKAIEKENK